MEDGLTMEIGVPVVRCVVEELRLDPGPALTQHQLTVEQSVKEMLMRHVHATTTLVQVIISLLCCSLESPSSCSSSTLKITTLYSLSHFLIADFTAFFITFCAIALLLFFSTTDAQLVNLSSTVTLTASSWSYFFPNSSS